MVKVVLFSVHNYNNNYDISGGGGGGGGGLPNVPLCRRNMIPHTSHAPIGNMEFMVQQCLEISHVNRQSYLVGSRAQCTFNIITSIIILFIHGRMKHCMFNSKE